ncbi:MAG TPA: 4Fe-4S dicluster domain-containing protein [Acidilobales archaeon]|nr:MAG: ferredoxin [Desulfurococcales archaeon ex4484_42]HDD26752.1 4Fe-4S dicluster domain-containing protein [Acidilobales archaeon]
MPRPVVDVEKCTGCGTCVSSCPQGVLELKEGKAVVANPDSCIGCRVCENVCPTGAVKVQD